MLKLSFPNDYREKNVWFDVEDPPRSKDTYLYAVSSLRPKQLEERIEFATDFGPFELISVEPHSEFSRVFRLRFRYHGPKQIFSGSLKELKRAAKKVTVLRDSPDFSIAAERS